MSRSRWLWIIVSFALMIGASVWVTATNWPPGGMPFLPAMAHIASFITALLETLSRALKVQCSARAIAYPIPFSTAVRVALGGDFAAGITPARSGAEPARFLLLGEAKMPAAGRIVVMFLELGLEVCSLAVVCGILAVVFRGQGTSTSGLLGVVVGYSAVVFAVGVGALLLSRRQSTAPPSLLRRLGVSQARWDPVHRFIRSTRESVGSIGQAHRGWMTVAFAASVFHVICKVATLPMLVALSEPTFHVTARSLAPLVLWPLALFYGGVVVPAPGGGGFIEGAFAATLKTAIPPTVFAATLLWWRFYTFYLYLITGGIAAGDAVFRALRSDRSHASPQVAPS